MYILKEPMGDVSIIITIKVRVYSLFKLFFFTTSLGLDLDAAFRSSELSSVGSMFEESAAASSAGSFASPTGAALSAWT
jgi:hypothetical protein